MDIEAILTALENTIENKKTEMHKARETAGTHAVLPHLFSEMIGKAEGSYTQISHLINQGGEFARSFLIKTQQNIEEQPWEALRRAAIYSFTIGMFLGLRSSRGKKE